MKNKNLVISLASLLLSFTIMAGTIATIVAGDSGEPFSILAQESSSTPRAASTLPPENPPPTIPTPNSVEPSPTVSALLPESGCAAAPIQFELLVNIRQEPGIASEIIGLMDFRWYPQDPSKLPMVADDGDGDDLDGNLWFAVKMLNGETGWVARRVVQTSNPDCFVKMLPLCPEDILTLTPAQQLKYDIVYFDEDCRLVEVMQNSLVVPIPADTFALFVEQSKSDASQTSLVFISANRLEAFSYSLSIEGPIHYPSLSPDGRLVAFLQNTKNGWILNSITLPTSEDGEIQEQPLLFSQADLLIVPGQIAWSPDSTMLLITMRDADRLNNVYWVDTVEETTPARRSAGLFIANASQPAYSPSMHPEDENDGLIAVVRSGRILITRLKPTLLRDLDLTDEQIEEWQIVIEDSLRSLPETPSCASQRQPAFNYSDEYSLYFVCERGGVGAALYMYQQGEPQQLDLPLVISPIQNIAPLRGWYIAFDDGEEIYTAQIEPDTSNVIETISLNLSSPQRNVLYMSWLSILEPLD